MVLIPAGKHNSYYFSYTNTSPLYMDETEVTKAQWDEVYNWAIMNDYSFDNAGFGKATNHPVHTVNWYDCVKWCNARSQMDGRMPCYTVSGAIYKTGSYGTTGSQVVDCNFSANGYRLPTATEFEYSSRGGLSGLRFPWGNTIAHSNANYYSDGDYWYDYDVSPTLGYHPSTKTPDPRTLPVKSFAANDYGLYDMVGNVMEWTSDFGSLGTSRQALGGGWNSHTYNVTYNGDGSYSPPSSASNQCGIRSVCR